MDFETIAVLRSAGGAVERHRHLATQAGLYEPVVFVVRTDSGFAANVLRGNAPSEVKDELRRRTRDGDALWIFCVSKTDASHLVPRLRDQIHRLSNVVVCCVGEQITLVART